MWENLKTWWGCTFRLPRDQRELMYQTMAAQLRAGVPAETAFETLATGVELSPQVTVVARAAARAAADGRGVVDGLAETLCVPHADLGVLRVAERTATLEEAFVDLNAAQAEGLGIMSRVVAPNAYYLVLLTLALAGTTQVTGLLAVVGEYTDLEGNNAYALSAAVNAYLGPVCAVAAAMVAVVLGGRGRLTGFSRRVLLVFDAEYRAQVAIRFCDFAARLYARGASHSEVLDAVEDALGGGGFVQKAIADARRDHVAAGMAFEDAIAGRLLSPALASVLKGMVPGGERRLYPGAFRAIAEIQRAMLRRRLGAAASAVRTLAAGAVGVMIAILVPGIYAAFSSAV